MAGVMMDTAMTLKALEMRRLSSARLRLDHDSRIPLLAREKARLEEDNARLLRQHAELTASAETWIRLYEAALQRANAAEAALAKLGARAE